MSKDNRLFLALIFFALSPTPLFAGDFDGSKPLVGTPGKIIEITPFKIIEHMDPERLGLPKRFFIDFDAKTLRPSPDSRIRKTVLFQTVKHIEEMMVLQGMDAGVEGVNDGLAWSLTISKKNGKAVFSASGDGMGYVVISECKTLENSGVLPP